MDHIAESPIAKVLSRLKGAKQSGKGWTACCPGHDDKDPSLSVTRTDDGTVLLKCHTGCSAEAVVKSIGLELIDLFPPKGNGYSGSKPSKRKAASADDKH